MAGSSENVKKAFDEGRFLDVVRAAKSRKNPEDRLLLGIALFKLGRQGEALDILSNIADLSQTLIKSFYYMALIHLQKQDDVHAKSCLQKYLAFYPDDDEARDLLEKPSASDMLMKEPSLELAKVYAQQGHFEQALDIYTQVDKLAGLDEVARGEAREVQDLFIMKTLQGWLERLKK
ncbi:MAG TPA: tetratricopeptide repeat protein [Desulfomonilia bacterium]|nr:tetratricopeptide repeat protein [Desulfomonilia bacterium]